jgi:hypothetical protein
VTPTTITDAGGSSKVSKAKFELPDAVADAARKRVADLLAQYRLYPEIALEFDGTGGSA